MTPKAKHPLLDISTCRDGTLPKITANQGTIYAAKIPECLRSRRTRRSVLPISCPEVLQSHAQTRKSTLKEPNSFKLTVPRSHKRPPLQTIEPSVVTTRHGFKTECLESDLNRSKPTVPTARDPSKRRGVIMTENMNIIGSNTISAAAPPAPNDTNSLDLSRFTSQISDLVASLSNSDLGSLEMNGDSDSETTFTDQRLISDKDALEQLQSLNAPRICKDIMGERAVGSTEIQINGRGSSSLISANFGSNRAADSMTSSLLISSSSSSTYSSFSNSLDSPTCLRPASHPPFFGLVNQQLISNKPPTFENKANSAALDSIVSTGRPKIQQASTSKQTGASRCKISSPRKPELTLKSKVKGSFSREKVKQSPVNPLPLTTIFTKSPITIRSSSKENNHLAPEQVINNPTHDLSVRGSKLWTGQVIFNRFSNTQSQGKSPSTATLPDKPVKSYLSPSGWHATSPMKPRSNTINTLLPSSTRPYSRQTLEPPLPSTKPRSNTVNTYSPTTRSPLSQHVTNGSHEFQSQSTQVVSSKVVPSHSVMPSLKVPTPKPVTSSKVTLPVAKPTAPLRVIKKLVRTGSRPGPAPRADGHIVPTAAFMLPKIPIVNAGRKVSSSVAPLIPTCPPSANGVISPNQCRSLLRNSLSGAGILVVR
ncbi:hypothetical protein HYPSUDRAFT_62893 [Hypholoma sublateritium FD-334 SS-4]|uniref:Uncharacterized protein n=1 Tax=Hypholoma sublateritium (strain FD-334 SS-4) TaxID=945553 RepID=A0A0D2MV26_HYPSF|nr:hypothetical protein HYPSUDRAFT_62893 [Hypholoma sublateritium FD-334 SS-4]